MTYLRDESSRSSLTVRRKPLSPPSGACSPRSAPDATLRSGSPRRLLMTLYDWKRSFCRRMAQIAGSRPHLAQPATPRSSANKWRNGCSSKVQDESCMARPLEFKGIRAEQPVEVELSRVHLPEVARVEGADVVLNFGSMVFA